MRFETFRSFLPFCPPNRPLPSLLTRASQAEGWVHSTRLLSPSPGASGLFWLQRSFMGHFLWHPRGQVRGARGRTGFDCGSRPSAPNLHPGARALPGSCWSHSPGVKVSGQPELPRRPGPEGHVGETGCSLWSFPFSDGKERRCAVLSCWVGRREITGRTRKILCGCRI